MDIFAHKKTLFFLSNHEALLVYTRITFFTVIFRYVHLLLDAMHDVTCNVYFLFPSSIYFARQSRGKGRWVGSTRPGCDKYRATVMDVELCSAAGGEEIHLPVRQVLPQLIRGHAQHPGRCLEHLIVPRRATVHPAVTAALVELNLM